MGVCGGLRGSTRTLRPLPWVIDLDGAKGLVGVVGGPPGGLGGRAGSDIDGNLSEDASSDKVRGVKDVKIPKISKIRKRGEAKHAKERSGGPFLYRQDPLWRSRASTSQRNFHNIPAPSILAYNNQRNKT